MPPVILDVAKQNTKTMETDDALLIAIFALVIYSAIMYWIVEAATRSKFLKREAYRQSLFMRAMAAKLGVPEEDIKVIQDKANKL